MLQNDQNLIFKSKPTPIILKERESQNNFVSNVVKSEISVLKKMGIKVVRHEAA